MQPEALKTFNIIQDLIMGATIPAVCSKFECDSEEVVEIMKSSPHFTALSPAMRKQIALARLDALAASTMPNAAKGDVTAINTYLKIQEREAKLTGMDTQTDDKVKLVLDIPWLSQDRLSYKHGGPVREDNVVDITPVLESRATMEPKEPVSGWKPPEPNPLVAIGVNSLIKDSK